MTRYWFRPKRYGYGATPVTWEGWALTVAVCAMIAGSIIVMELMVDRANFMPWMIWAALVGGITLWFVRIGRGHTDGDWRWRWGRDPGST